MSRNTATTLLAPNERSRFDTLSQGYYRGLHRDSIEQLLRDLRSHSADVVVVSAASIGQREAMRLATVVREFPRVPAIALLSTYSSATAQTVLTLGRSGVRTVVDIQSSRGWNELHSLLIADSSRLLERAAMAMLNSELPSAPGGNVRFFEVVFRRHGGARTVRQLADVLSICASTLMSRFFRAKLPPPKQYLALARLTHAARLLENPGASVSSVANSLDYSSPQSFGRHLQLFLQLTPREFRRRYDGDGMLECFRAELVAPYKEQLQAFDPLVSC
ncbi:MAG TPA: helix-turn-helix domain-containing protein [Gemmatimonadaceae bacterium]|nr:helix-turn-helix domain-containing protein [Gemmatimonadaceae bacterium]